jgi:predicted double-glycine peptidase
MAVEASTLAVPARRQETKYSCGPAALRAVLAAFGVRISEDALIERLKTSKKDGTTPESMHQQAESLGLGTLVREPMSLKDLKKATDAGYPVIVLFQAWQEGKKRDWAGDWDDGHYAVVTSVQGDHVFLSDPSMSKGTGYIPASEFEERWHDENENRRYHRWGLVIRVPSPESFKKTFTKVS